jgi:hypothetical protein
LYSWRKDSSVKEERMVLNVNEEGDVEGVVGVVVGIM